MNNGGQEEDIDQDEYEQAPSFTSSPGHMVLSFVIVAGSYVLLGIVLVMIYFGLLNIFEPEAARLFQETPPEEFEKIVVADPEKIWPANVCIALVPAAAIVSFGFGYCVAWAARFGKFGHGAILAVLCFISLLQFGLSNTLAPKWIFMVMMILVPLTILLGSQARLRRSHS